MILQINDFDLAKIFDDRLVLAESHQSRKTATDQNETLPLGPHLRKRLNCLEAGRLEPMHGQKTPAPERDFRQAVVRLIAIGHSVAQR